jgi:hypothetical protein
MPTYQGQFVAGQTLNAADLNAFTPAAIYTSSGNLSVPNATFTLLSFASYGSAGITSWVGAGNGRITPAISGYYLITSNVQMTASTANRSILGIYKNGAVVFSNDIIAGVVGQSLSGLIFCNGTTDYITSVAYHATGAAINYTAYQLSVSLMWQ